MHFAEIGRPAYTSYGIETMEEIFVDIETCQTNHIAQCVDSFVNLMKLADVSQLRNRLTAAEKVVATIFAYYVALHP